MNSIAFLGLGRMGQPMAQRLLATGHELVVWNRSPGRATEFERMGARRATSPAEAAGAAKTIVSMLSDGAAVESVLTGERGVIAGLSAGTLVIDCSTVGPQHARQFASLVREAGGRFVDAPVLGSVPAAKGGTLTVLAGGADTDVDGAEPILRDVGTVVRTGEVGSGNALKLVMNLLVGGVTDLLAEAIVLARGSGLSMETVRETLFASVLKSPFLEYKAPQLFDRKFAPLFSTALMLKDMNLVLEQAREVGVELPTSTQVRDAYAAAAKQGHAQDDFAAVITAVEGR